MKHIRTSLSVRRLIELSFIVSFLVGMLVPFTDPSPTNARKVNGPEKSTKVPTAPNQKTWGR